MQRFQFTLRAARICSGYTVEEVAIALGLPARKINRYEEDSGRIPLGIADQLLRLYGVSSDTIFFGKEADCIQYNHQRKIDLYDAYQQTIQSREAVHP